MLNGGMLNKVHVNIKLISQIPVVFFNCSVQKILPIAYNGRALLALPAIFVLI